LAVLGSFSALLVGPIRCFNSFPDFPLCGQINNYSIFPDIAGSLGFPGKGMSCLGRPFQSCINSGKFSIVLYHLYLAHLYTI